MANSSSSNLSWQPILMVPNEPETTRTIEMARRTRKRIILFYRGFVNVLTICRNPFNAKQKTCLVNLWTKIGQMVGKFGSISLKFNKIHFNSSSYGIFKKRTTVLGYSAATVPAASPLTNIPVLRKRLQPGIMGHQRSRKRPPRPINRGNTAGQSSLSRVHGVHAVRQGAPKSSVEILPGRIPCLKGWQRATYTRIRLPTGENRRDEVPS